jgi:hypothetical protein
VFVSSGGLVATDPPVVFLSLSLLFPDPVCYLNSV